MARVLGRVVRGALALAGMLVLLAALAAVGLWALSRGWQRERVRSAAEAWLTRAFADAGICAEVHIGALTGPLYPELALHDVALVCGAETVARIGEAALRFDLRFLYSERRVVIERARIAGVQLALARDERERWPWQAEPAAPSGASARGEPRPFSLELRALELASAEVDVRWRQAGLESHVAAALSGDASELALPRSGPPAWPASARISVAVAPGVVAGQELRGAQLSLALRESHLAIETSHLESAFGSARLQGETDLAGWLDTGAAARVHVEGQVDDLDLGVLLARPELAGRVAARLRVDGTHVAGTDPRAARAELALSLSGSRVGRLDIAGGQVRASYNAGRWRLESASLASSAARLEARGSGDLERIAALDADLEVSDLAALAAVVGESARGKARVKLHLAGAWRAPRGTAEIDTRELAVAALEVGRITLRARSADLARYRVEPLVVDGPRLQLAADGPVLLRRAAGGLEVERARLRLGPGESLDLAGGISSGGLRGFRVELGHVALARVGALAGLAEPLGGHLAGEIRASGAWPRPALEGHLAWEAPSVREVSADAISLDLATRGGMLRADGRIAARGRDLLAAHFAMPWTERSDLASVLAHPDTRLEIRGDSLELALLQELAPLTLERVEGAVSVRVELRGGSQAPSLDGELRVENAGFDVPVLGQRFGPLDARLVLANDALRVDRFVLSAGGEKRAELGGEIRLANLVPSAAELRLALHDLPIRWQTNLQARASGQVDVRGPLDALAAQGEIELRGLRYSLSGGVDPLLGEVSVRDSRRPEPRPRAPLQERSALYDRARVDVAIDVASDGRVQGQGANLEIAGKLRAAKDPGGPLVLLGAIDTTRGSYRIHGKTFVVEQAHVEFTGRPDLDPELDVRAMHRVRDVRVYALVRGRASAPSIQLSSDPPYPQDDVLALLLFGKTRDELGQAQAGALESTLAGTAGVAALESLNRRLGIEIPVEAIDVGSAGPSGSSGETSVGLGGYVTEDIFVRYGRALGSESESNVRVDWRLQRRWSVEGQISTRGDSSADLIWTYDY